MFFVFNQEKRKRTRTRLRKKKVMDTLKELLYLLEERLVEHDNNRKEVQSELGEVCAEIGKDADLLEEKLNEEVCKAFDKTEERIFNLITKFNNRIEHPESSKDNTCALIKQAQQILSSERNYEIGRSEKAKGFSDSYRLKVSSTKVKKDFNFDSTTSEASKIELITAQLQEHLVKFQESKIGVQDQIVELCNEKRKEAEKLETRINRKLEALFSQEDARIQGVVKMVKENIDSKNPEKVKNLARVAKTTLSKSQSYSLNRSDSYDKCNLSVKKGVSLKFAKFEERKPENLVLTFTKKGELSLSFTFFNEDEVEFLKELKLHFEVEVNFWEKDHDESTSKLLTEKFTLGEPIRLRSSFAASTSYGLKIRIVHQETSTQWSHEAKFTTPEFKDLCTWKECPDNVKEKMKYSVDEENPRIATKADEGDWDFLCTVIGNTPLPLKKVASWSVKVLKSRKNDGGWIYIGIAPSDIDQNEFNFNKCGWYLHCYDSVLRSGPPHEYFNKEYGPKKGSGKYAHTGDSVGVVMDTAKGELSFVVNGVNLGVAYEGIPLDKPLVPCVLLNQKGDSVELDTSEVKENVDSSVPVPFNITTKKITWDSITLSWDAIEGASFYQIEVDGSIIREIFTANGFTKRELLPETEHNFRVRAVKENSVSEWSDAVKERVQKESFETSGWKKGPVIYYGMRYSVDKNNPRVARKMGERFLINGRCTIIGNAHLPPNKIVSWSIKVLKSKRNNSLGIFVGVAPSDIDHENYENPWICGWYFNCHDATLCSGPPHYYRGKAYGPRKGNGEYVHTGDSVGVVMDTANGELSFVVNGVNPGVAYEGIPLDKPLVPCVILEEQDDSVELVI